VTAKTGNSFIPSTTGQDKIWGIRHRQLERRMSRKLRQRSTTSEIAIWTKTGNTCSSGNVADTIEIAVLSTASSLNFCPSNFDNDRQQEMNYSCFGANLAVSGYPSLSLSFARYAVGEQHIIISSFLSKRLGAF